MDPEGIRGDPRGILRQRARALASNAAPGGSIEGESEVLEFVLAQEHFAIAARSLREVCPVRHLTPVPCTPGLVLGIMNLRGEFLSVMDLAKLFDLSEDGLLDRKNVIVVESVGMRLGVLADVIVGMRRMAGSGIESLSPALTGARAAYLLGLAEGMAVLDMEKVLSDPGIIVREEVQMQSGRGGLAR